MLFSFLKDGFLKKKAGKIFFFVSLKERKKNQTLL
jgi:hypothetical protein